VTTSHDERETDDDLYDMDVDDLRDELRDLRSEIDGYRNNTTQRMALSMAAGCVHELEEEVADLKAELERVTFERDVLKTNQIIAFGA
jgi:ribosomal protein L29